MRITQMIMLAPVTAQTAEPAKAPIRSTSVPLLTNCGIARKNHATLKIRYRVESSRNRHGRPVLIEGIEESSPPSAGRLVELESEGLLLSLAVSDGHDDRDGLALNRRYGLEGKGTAISTSMLARAAHIAFGVVGHGASGSAKPQHICRA